MISPFIVNFFSMCMICSLFASCSRNRDLQSLSWSKHFMTMGVDTVESELAHVSVETGGNSSLLQKENGKLNKDLVINELKKEVTNLPENNFPKDAADEWPAPKEVHSFYIVKYRSYDDPKLKVKFDQAEKELKRLKQAISQIKEKLRAKRVSERFYFFGDVPPNCGYFQVLYITPFLVST